MNLQEFFTQFIPQIEAEMRECLSSSDPALSSYYGMFYYHLGWADEHFMPAQINSGKRIRPMLCVLACHAAQGDPAQAIPMAAGVELLHNFSLIHDDIEDNSPTRRGRPAVWKLWGMPQAINAGDGMFTLAHLAMDRLRCRGVSCDRIMDVRETFDRACLALTHGQYLDISFESRERVSVDEYRHMISGKTAALIGASTAIGATLAGSPTVAQYEAFGRELGLAFQIQDDVLDLTSKGFAKKKGGFGQDVTEGKRSLMVIHTLETASSADKKRLIQILNMHISDQKLRNEAIQIMQKYKAIDYARTFAMNLMNESWDAIDKLLPPSEGKEKLKAFATYLVQRKI